MVFGWEGIDVTDKNRTEQFIQKYVKSVNAIDKSSALFSRSKVWSLRLNNEPLELSLLKDINLTSYDCLIVKGSRYRNVHVEYGLAESVATLLS